MTDILDQYLRELSRSPLLTRVEELALGRRVRAGGRLGEKARNELAQRNLRFVVKIAKQYKHRGVPLLDLIAEGNMAMLKAAETFDPDKNTKFISYAVRLIRWKIWQLIARQSRVVTLPANGGADALRVHDVSVDGSRDTPNGGKGGLLIDRLHPEAATSAKEPVPNFEEDRALNSLVVYNIRVALAKLPEPDATVLHLYFGLDNDREHTLQEIATKLGMNRERVRQLRNRALQRAFKSNGRTSPQQLSQIASS